MAGICNSCSAVAQVQLIAGWRAAVAVVCNSCSAVTQVQLIAVGREAMAVPLVHDAA